MKKIYKYQVKITDEQTLSLPMTLITPKQTLIIPNNFVEFVKNEIKPSNKYHIGEKIKIK